MKPEILEEKSLSMIETKDLLSKIKKRDEELNFRGNKTEEYLNNVLKISSKQGKELKEKLINLEIPRLKENHIFKIIDILPKNVEELKVILQGYTITVNADNMKRIVEVVKEFIPIKK